MSSNSATHQHQLPLIHKREKLRKKNIVEKPRKSTCHACMLMRTNKYLKNYYCKIEWLFLHILRLLPRYFLVCGLDGEVKDLLVFVPLRITFSQFLFTFYINKEDKQLMEQIIKRAYNTHVAYVITW